MAIKIKIYLFVYLFTAYVLIIRFQTNGSQLVKKYIAFSNVPQEALLCLKALTRRFFPLDSFHTGNIFIHFLILVA